MGLWTKGVERSKSGNPRTESLRDHWMAPYIVVIQEFIQDYLNSIYPKHVNTCDFKFHIYDVGSLSGKTYKIIDTIWNICGEEVVMNHTTIYQQNPYRGLMGQLVDGIKRMPNPSSLLLLLLHKVELNIQACTDYINRHYCDENKEVLFQI